MKTKLPERKSFPSLKPEKDDFGDRQIARLKQVVKTQEQQLRALEAQAGLQMQCASAAERIKLIEHMEHMALHGGTPRERERAMNFIAKWAGLDRPIVLVPSPDQGNANANVQINIIQPKPMTREELDIMIPPVQR